MLPEWFHFFTATLAVHSTSELMMGDTATAIATGGNCAQLLFYLESYGITGRFNYCSLWLLSLGAEGRLNLKTSSAAV